MVVITGVIGVTDKVPESVAEPPEFVTVILIDELFKEYGKSPVKVIVPEEKLYVPPGPEFTV